jgi:hypothetical protein
VAEFQQADIPVVEKKIVLCGKGARVSRFWELGHAQRFLAGPTSSMLRNICATGILIKISDRRFVSPVRFKLPKIVPFSFLSNA